MSKMFEEALADLVTEHFEEGFEAIISAMELQIMALKEQEREQEQGL
jgi:hypothetical protein